MSAENESLEARVLIFRRILQLVAMIVNPNPKVIDLGCGHCRFLEEVLAFGWYCIGVDARIERVPEIIRRERFIESRIEDVDLEPYAIVLALGILYHMPLAAQMEFIGRLGGKVVILDTHYSRSPRSVVKIGGIAYSGEIYREGNLLTSGFGHKESYWLSEEHLIRMLWANHDVLKWLPEHHPGRSFYLMIPR